MFGKKGRYSEANDVSYFLLGPSVVGVGVLYEKQKPSAYTICCLAKASNVRLCFVGSVSP